LVDDVAPVDRPDVVLRALLGPLHRSPEATRDRNRDRPLAVDLDLRAEAAADVGCDHADLRLGDAEHKLEHEALDVWRLCRRPQRDVAGRSHLRKHSPRLDRVRDEARLVVAPSDDHVGGVYRRLHRLGLELPQVALVRSEVLVDDRRAVRERLLDACDRRERLPVDVDELGGVLCERARLSDDYRNRIALVPRLVGGEGEVRRHLDVLGHGPCARESSCPLIREICARVDGDHALRRAGGVEVHALDACARVGAAHDDHVRGARERQVLDVRASTTQERRVLLALDGGSHHLGSCLDRGHDATPAADATALTMLW
jgi:hypothetical protein